MMRHKGLAVLVALLLALSAGFYLLHYSIFHDTHHIILYLIGDIAFLPVDVLIVTLVLHRLLEYREKRSMLQKLNMVIGAFFSEVGYDLLARFRAGGAESETAGLRAVAQWSEADFAKARKSIAATELTAAPDRAALTELKAFLLARREFLLVLLENPTLLEHESFTELLWAVTHLTEELVHRHSLDSIPDSDLQHLHGDVRRAYRLLALEWLSYMRHLKMEYPYLFSLAARLNPFNPSAEAEVKS